MILVSIAEVIFKATFKQIFGLFKFSFLWYYLQKSNSDDEYIKYISLLADLTLLDKEREISFFFYFFGKDKVKQVSMEKLTWNTVLFLFSYL